MDDELNLVGAREIQALLGVSKQRVYQITKIRDFPPPAAHLRQGRIWHAEDVQAWITKHRGPRD